MSKTAIRKRILSQRDTLTAVEIATLSAEVAKRFLASPFFARATTLALYCAIRSEVATAPLFNAAQRAGKRILYPHTRGETLEFVAVTTLEELALSRFGILEPVTEAGTPLAEIDLIVLPGVAFDARGIRLGYGLGCYDRALAAAGKPLLVGLAYDFQIVPVLPREQHDIPVDIVVTESRILSI